MSTDVTVVLRERTGGDGDGNWLLESLMVLMESRLVVLNLEMGLHMVVVMVRALVLRRGVGRGGGNAGVGLGTAAFGGGGILGDGEGSDVGGENWR